MYLSWPWQHPCMCSFAGRWRGRRSCSNRTRGWRCSRWRRRRGAWPSVRRSILAVQSPMQVTALLSLSLLLLCVMLQSTQYLIKCMIQTQLVEVNQFIGHSSIQLTIWFHFMCKLIIYLYHLQNQWPTASCSLIHICLQISLHIMLPNLYEWWRVQCIILK